MRRPLRLRRADHAGEHGAELGVSAEVVHHTQLLNRLVRDGRLTPVAPPAGSVGGRAELVAESARSKDLELLAYCSPEVPTALRDLAFLRTVGWGRVACDEAQGYFYGRPMSPASA